MNKKTRKSLIFATSLALALTAGASVQALNASAEDFKPEVFLREGASVRAISDNYGFGIRFTMGMDKASYENVLADANYTEVSYGVIIADKSYELNYKNVFSDEAIYAYATWNEDENKWNDYVSELPRVYNFSSDALYVNKLDGETENNVYFRGALTGLTGENCLTEFQAVGYVTYKYKGEVGYDFTDNQVRSMTYVAQRAVEDGDVNSEFLKTSYVTPFVGRETVYTVENYVEQANGTYKIAETQEVNGALADTVTNYGQAEEKTYAGYAFDAENKNNVAGGTVYANGKLTLKKYYNYVTSEPVDMGLLNTADQATVKSISLEDVAENLNRKLYRGIGKALVNANYTEDQISLEGLDGLYVFEATKDDGTVVASVTFDAYDPNGELVWSEMDLSYAESIFRLEPRAGGAWIPTENTLSIVNGSDIGMTGTSNYYKLEGFASVTETSFPRDMGIKVYPVHSLAYYKTLPDTITMKASYNVMHVNADTSENVSGASGQLVELYGEDYWNINGGWKSREIALSTVLAAWESSTTGLPTMLYEYQLHRGNTTYTNGQFVMYLGDISLNKPQMYWANAEDVTWGATANHDTTNGICRTTQYNKTTYFYATSEEKNEVGATAAFFKITVNGGFYGWGKKFKILPTNDKAYYEQFAGQKLAFDWWYDIEGVTTYAFTPYGEEKANYTSKTIYTVTIDIDDILENWDAFSKKGSDSAFVDPAWIISSGNDPTTALNLFIGNIRLA